VLAAVCALLISSAGVSAARQATPAARAKVDVSKLGPQVGQRVPDFTLTDQNGRTRTLASIMGAKGAMLVFVRSADW
jgi:cytochrome oxidase Cu insertion factor (SCO1/SenC/PrrC family)